MTRTPDEIKKGLECCTHNNCNACPYRDKKVGCRPYRNDDALALIQQLQDGIDQWERVAASPGAVEDMARENTELSGKIGQLETKCNQLEADKQQLEGMLTHMNQLRDAAAGRALKMEECVHQLEAERDAAVEDIKEAHDSYCGCVTCKNYRVNADCQEPPDTFCPNCSHDYCPCKGCSSNLENWQWRGVQKEDCNAKSP